MDEKNKRSSHPPEIISAKNYYEKGWRVIIRSFVFSLLDWSFAKVNFIGLLLMTPVFFPCLYTGWEK